MSSVYPDSVTKLGTTVRFGARGWFMNARDRVFFVRRQLHRSHGLACLQDERLSCMLPLAFGLLLFPLGRRAPGSLSNRSSSLLECLLARGALRFLRAVADFRPGEYPSSP